MVDLLQEDEATPASYPTVPSGLSEKAAGLDAGAIWARIESYTAHRFTERQVIWIIEGFEGQGWKPPLKPILSHTAEKWEDGAWMVDNLRDGPLGLFLTSCGHFRITAQVGGGDLPAPVSEAYRRLAEYSVEIAKDGMMSGHASHHAHSVNIGGEIQESYDRSRMWAARALELSGAADLLRPYRRA
ncbi:hypothetical protein [Roseobacter sp. S98]|uniref:hypothetical protein n=1 Tax=Roseobacter algicola (ex Choi et al. 2025) (nom. illeg.) TaxID=3092138 RepID=UPI0035C6B22D